jgi:16S rRNA A1518/A1519 N6-dimethyltransferase RsmA/KsgA/DIM1 with predicted DNA glycosylase/AP lyase activity
VSLSAAPWFELSLAEPFRRRDFTPAPGVDVALLRIARRAVPDLDGDGREAWAGFVRHAFGRGRADARGAFRGLLSHLQWRRLGDRLGLAPDARLAELAYSDWLAIFRFALASTPSEKQRRAGMVRASTPSPSGWRAPAPRVSGPPRSLSPNRRG